MLRIIRFGRDKEAAYQADQAEQMLALQRWLMLAGGAVYGLAGLFVSVAVGDASGGLTLAALALLGATLLLWALTYIPAVRGRLEWVPVVIALLYSTFLIFSLVLAPQGGGLRAAFLFGSLAAFVVLLAPSVQSALAAIAATVLLAAGAFGAIFPAMNADIPLFEALSYASPLYGLTICLAMAVDVARRAAFSYKRELTRRATTDDISGVSNRAHIHQLAQNEYGRARRYQEPLSALAIEIDGYDSVLEHWGPEALDTLIQVFSGYCVIVMRHCDSFGRLGPKRFLALLPETASKGAMILAHRMCRDIARLDVVVDDEILNFTVTIGAAELHAGDRWAGDFMRRANQALEDAIDSGRNTAVLALDPPHAHANDATPTIAAQAPRPAGARNVAG
ncbi:MAG: diguanylate cyclase [Rhodospirillaceae bacterium]|nr:diguanylate cyclase [Rhodospirillaceae bacterium]